MTIENTKAVLTGFIKSSGNEVLALSGAWGIGKTYVWNQLLQLEAKQIQKKRYSYVSLFGVTDIKELRTAIFMKSQPSETAGRRLTLADQVSSFQSFTSKAQAIPALARNLLPESNPWGKLLSVGLESAATQFIGDTLICFDDFERQEKIDVDQFLGLISELKEERGCSVLVIFNSQGMDEARRARFRAYKEKVIDSEIEFSPSVEESFSLIFSDTFPHRAELLQNVQDLRISNIRILRRCHRLASMLLNELNGEAAMIRTETLFCVVLFCWCLYSSDADRPSLDDIENWNRLYLAVLSGNDRNSPEGRIATKLQTYGLLYVTDFYTAIAHVVKQGYVGTEFKSELQARAHKNADDEAGERYRRAFRLLDGSFKDNEREVIDSLYTTARAMGQRVNIGDLDYTIEVLRALGEERAAIDLVDNYFKEVGSDEKKLSGITELLYRPISDKYLLDSLNKARSAAKPPTFVKEALLFKIKQGGYNHEHLHALKVGDAEEYVRAFTELEGSDLPAAIKECMQMGGIDADIPRKAWAALQTLAGQSRLNEIRMKRYSAPQID